LRNLLSEKKKSEERMI